MNEINASGYDRDLFDLVLSRVRGLDKRVETVLLWRGFLARRDGAGVFLCTGSADGDVEMLQENGFAFQRIAAHPDSCAEILNSRTLNDQTLFRLFNQAPADRLPGPIGGLAGQGWDAFIRCSFGAKIPVRVLDPGIALLVKTLPLLGLHVVDSGDGHLSNPPWIRFLSTHHLDWARLVLPLFAPKGDRFKREWVFRSEPWNSPRWEFPKDTGVWLFGTNGCGPTLDGRFSLYSAIQSLAANIIENGRAARLREGKKRL